MQMFLERFADGLLPELSLDAKLDKSLATSSSVFEELQHVVQDIIGIA